MVVGQMRVLVPSLGLVSVPISAHLAWLSPPSSQAPWDARKHVRMRVHVDTAVGRKAMNMRKHTDRIPGLRKFALLLQTHRALPASVELRRQLLRRCRFWGWRRVAAHQRLHLRQQLGVL